MLMIRLQRTGRTNEPTFRLILTDKRNGTKSGRFLEVLGSYDARQDVAKQEFKADLIKEWIAKGAQLSDTAHNLLVEKKIIEGKKVNALPQKTPVIDEEAIKKAAEEATKLETEKVAKEAAAAPVEEVAPEAPTEEVTPVPEAPLPTEDEVPTGDVQAKAEVLTEINGTEKVIPANPVEEKKEVKA